MTSPHRFAEPTGSTPSRVGSSTASPGPSEANESTIAALRSAVRQCMAPQAGGQDSLRRCARAARANGIKPEDLVRLIHAAFDEYDGHHGPRVEFDRRRLDLSNVALDAYFAEE